MVLAQKQKHKSVEQERKPRNKPTRLANSSTTKEARIISIQWIKDDFFNHQCWGTWTAACEEQN